MRGGPDEALLRERNKARTPGFFVDGALEEASPKIRLELDSRWVSYFNKPQTENFKWRKVGLCCLS